MTRRYLVTGKVQGVYFRHTTRLQAERLGLQGVARNLANGSVEVVVHGEADAIDILYRWLERGPTHARVDAVEEVEAPRDMAPPCTFAVE